MKGRVQARVVTEALAHMAHLQRFTVPQLVKACGLDRSTVRSTVQVVEERGWVTVDGFGERMGGHGRGAVPVAYRWRGVEINAAVSGPQRPAQEVEDGTE